jgi:hypothetical protein
MQARILHLDQGQRGVGVSVFLQNLLPLSISIFPIPSGIRLWVVLGIGKGLGAVWESEKQTCKAEIKRIPA